MPEDLIVRLRTEAAYFEGLVIEWQDPADAENAERVAVLKRRSGVLTEAADLIESQGAEMERLTGANTRMGRLGRAVERERDEYLEALTSEREARERDRAEDHEALLAADEKHRELAAALSTANARIEMLEKVARIAREGLAIAASWASRKPDSQNARDKIRAGLDAIRSALSTKGGDHAG
jgi:hypothetical protein